MENIGFYFLSVEFLSPDVGVKINFFKERLDVFVRVVMNTEIGFDNWLAGDPDFVDCLLEETVSFVEKSYKGKMGGFSMFE